MSSRVEAVCSNDDYSFSKPSRERIVLVPGLGVEGDIHAGPTVRHRSRVAVDPTQPNLRQVHLMRAELFAEIASQGYDVPCGGLGENVTTTGLDLLALPVGTILRFGPRGRSSGSLVSPAGTSAADVVAAARLAQLSGPVTAAVDALEEAIRAESEREGDGRAAIVVTGLRNPCAQINSFRPGLLRQVLGRDDSGNTVRRAGIMAVVLRAGEIRPGDPVSVEAPSRPHRALDLV